MKKKLQIQLELNKRLLRSLQILDKAMRSTNLDVAVRAAEIILERCDKSTLDRIRKEFIKNKIVHRLKIN